MSLISFLDVPDVKEKFRHEFKIPKLATEKELRAPPLSRRYSLIGTAFDYLLRFWVQRHNNNVMSTPWVAELACQTLYSDNCAEKDNRVYDIYTLHTIEGFECSAREPDITKPVLTKPVVKPKITKVAIYFIRKACGLDRLSLKPN